MRNMTINHNYAPKVFYHGTTDNFHVGKVLLPPIMTGNLREDWRKNNGDVVFFTTSLASAKQYAKKAVKKYGGNPVVYQVKPIGSYYQRVNQEYIAEKARILTTV